jgi:multidrug transporter EmrE-like cation transporter
MPWVLLLFAGVLEVAWAVGLKYTGGFVLFQEPATALRLVSIGFIVLGIAGLKLTS